MIYGFVNIFIWNGMCVLSQDIVLAWIAFKVNLVLNLTKYTVLFVMAYINKLSCKANDKLSTKEKEFFAHV